MLSLFRPKQKPAVQAEPVKYIEAEPTETVRRARQQNIKASEDCCEAFARIAKAQGMSKAELFEDLVAERLEMLRRQGVKVEPAG
ncbi:MAG: ribbon-helix-helix protein, CopG family [Rhodomicrobium sp.]